MSWPARSLAGSVKLTLFPLFASRLMLMFVQQHESACLLARLPGCIFSPARSLGPQFCMRPIVEGLCGRAVSARGPRPTIDSAGARRGSSKVVRVLNGARSGLSQRSIHLGRPANKQTVLKEWSRPWMQRGRPLARPDRGPSLSRGPNRAESSRVEPASRPARQTGCRRPSRLIANN